MLAGAVDQGRHRLEPDHVDAAADEREALPGEVDDDRREGQLAVEPRLDRVVVRGGDVRRLRRHQGADMCADDLLSGSRGRLLLQEAEGGAAADQDADDERGGERPP